MVSSRSSRETGLRDFAFHSPPGPVCQNWPISIKGMKFYGRVCGSLKNVSEFRSRRYKISAVVGKASCRRFSVTRLHDQFFEEALNPNSCSRLPHLSRAALASSSRLRASSNLYFIYQAPEMAGLNSMALSIFSRAS